MRHRPDDKCEPSCRGDATHRPDDAWRRPYGIYLLLACIALCPLTTENAVFAQGGATGQLQQGVALYGKKSYSAALAHFAAALTSGNSATAIYYSALCYQQLGDSVHAQNCFKQVCEYFPNSREAALARQGMVLRDQAQQSRTRVQEQAGIINAVSAAVKAATAETSATMPGPTASDAEVRKFMSDYQLSDAEWKALPDSTKIPFVRGTSSHLFVNGYVNGRPMRMMFDTGANDCVFYKRDIEAAGVKLDPSGPHMKIHGIGGSADAQMMMAEISLGDLKRRIPIVVSSTPFGFSLIGESFFKDFRYNVDNGSGFLEFIKKPRDGMTASSHVYESTDVVKVPYEQVGNNMVVTVKINGHPAKMFFDTGAYAITMSAYAAPALGVTFDAESVAVRSSGVGGGVNGYKVYVDRIELGPITKTHVPVVFNQSMSPPLLGQPFFADRKFTIDTDNHTINFAH